MLPGVRLTVVKLTGVNSIGWIPVRVNLAEVKTTGVLLPGGKPTGVKLAELKATGVMLTEAKPVRVKLTVFKTIGGVLNGAILERLLRAFPLCLTACPHLLNAAHQVGRKTSSLQS